MEVNSLRILYGHVALTLLLLISFVAANPFSQLYTVAYNDGNLFVQKNILVVCNNQLSIITRTINAVCNTTVNIELSNTGIEPVLDVKASEIIAKLNKSEALPSALLNESVTVSNSISPTSKGKIVFLETPVKGNSTFTWDIGSLDPGAKRTINYLIDGYLQVNKSDAEPQLNYTLPSVKFLLNDGKVGRAVSVKVISSGGGVPLPNTSVEVISPSNEKKLYRTDRYGTLEFTPKEPGLYKYAVSNRSLEGIRSNFIADVEKQVIEKPEVAAALEDSSYENIVRKYLPAITTAVIILILIVIGASYFFLRPGREEVVQPPKGLVEEAAKDFEEKKQRTLVERGEKVLTKKPMEKPKVTIAKRRVVEEESEEEEPGEENEAETEEFSEEPIEEGEELEEKNYEDQLRKLIEEAQKFRKQQKETVSEEEKEVETPKKQVAKPKKAQIKKRKR